MSKKLDELYDRVQTFECETGHHQELLPATRDIFRVLNLMADLITEIQAQERRNARAGNITSCLANGMQPD